VATLHFQDNDYDIDLDPDSFTFDEMERIEKVLGASWNKIMDNAKAGSLTTIRAFLWIGLRRLIDGLRYEDTGHIRMKDVMGMADEVVVDPLGLKGSDAVIAEPSVNSSESDLGNGDSSPPEISVT
jgi:hypothetical protein